MSIDLDGFVQQQFEIKENEGRDKVVSLNEAIQRNVKPGMKLHIAVEANAAINEIIRQFYGKKPGFTLIMPGVIGVALNLIYCRLTKKVITSNYSFLAPFIAPCKIAQNVYRDKSVEFENWTLCTIFQRLMAGALGFPFIPTKSIIGSDMEDENKKTFKIINDPFGSGEDVPLVSALNPDVSLIHAWAADRYGNTIISPASPAVSWDGHLWGTKASKKAIITVEKLVTTDFIRKHSSQVKLPGYMVDSVSVVPMGAHPVCFVSQGVEAFEGYGDDYDFIIEHKKATKDPGLLDKWLDKWIFDHENHEGYLDKLGSCRIEFLKKKTGKNAWKDNAAKVLPDISLSENASESERMVIMASRVIRKKILENDYKAILGGAGVASLASWVAYYLLKEKNYDIELMSGTGIFGYAPRPSDSFFASVYNMPSCKMLTDTLDIYGVIVAGPNARSMSVLGAGQIDKNGNVNSTRIGDSFITGSGGSNDAACAGEVVIVAEQSLKRFVEKVPYVTYPGTRVKTIISSLGIFEKLEEDEFVLTGYFADPGLQKHDDIIKKIKDNCGWQLKIAKNVIKLKPPSREELLLLRVLDA